MGPPDGASDVMGSGTGWPPPVAGGTRDSGIDTIFCFFFGCGSTVDEARCLDRTGTGIVGRDVTRKGSVTVEVPGVGSGPGSVMRTGISSLPQVWWKYVRRPCNVEDACSGGTQVGFRIHHHM